MEEDQLSSGQVDGVERGLSRPLSRIVLEPQLESAYLRRTDRNRRTTIAGWQLGALLANLAVLPLDHVAGQFQLGAALRLGVVTPVYLLAILVLMQGIGRLQSLAIILPPVTFAAVISYLSVHAHEPHSDRYLMAAGLLLVFNNLVLPISFRQALLATALSILAMFGTVHLKSGLTTDSAAICAFIASTSIMPLMVRFQAERAARNAFLVELRDELKSAQLVALTKALAELAETDPLTGMRNRRSLSETLNRKWTQQCARNGWFGILMIDIDRFKLFNDTAGHDAGDRCLERVALALQTEIDRAGYYVARFGGEEFTAILSDVPPEPALQIAEALRSAVERLAIPHPAGPDGAPVTISIGASIIQASADMSVEDVIGAADSALYKAKANGRNCVVGSAATSAYIARRLMKDAG